MEKQKVDREKERKSRDTIMEMTEYDFYINLQYQKFFNNGDVNAREKCFFGLEDRIDSEKENIVNGVKQAAFGRLKGKNEAYDFWRDSISKNAGTHIHSLMDYRIGDVIDKIYNHSGYKKENIDEKAPELTKHYNKTLSELAEQAKLGKEDMNKELARDYSAIMDLYTKSVTIKYDRELVTKMGYKEMDNLLEQYFPKKPEEQEQQQKKAA